MVSGVAACGGSESGASESTTTVAPIQVSYHPCDQLPPDVMSRLGFDMAAAYRQERTDPVSLECTFAHSNPRYGASVVAMGQEFDEVVGDQRLVEKERTSIAGRDVSVADFTGGVSCRASIDIPPGTLQVSVDYRENSPRPEDELNNVDEACAEAMNIVNALGPYLPERL
nr:DUF3558 family protein [Rhodococcus sp. HNM0569]